MHRLKWFILIVSTTGILTSCGPRMHVYDPLLKELLESRPEWFNPVLQNARKHELQILYTQIDRDSLNRPVFKTHQLLAQPKQYFYPASSIKLYAAILALQKLNELDRPGLDKYTTLRIDSAYSGQTSVDADSSSPNHRPSVAHYIKKLFLVSDNDAFNRLYEFLGQQYLNEELWKRGLKETRLFHRLSINYSTEQNRYTNPITFYDGKQVIYAQDLVYNPNPLSLSIPGTLRGRGYIEDGQLIADAKDFSEKNYSPLAELQKALQLIFFPAAFSQEEQFLLKEDDYRFLYKYLSKLPRESRYPAYPDQETHYDSYVKFFIYGNSREPIPANVRVFNKVGSAFGYLTDNAYIVDFDEGIEFLLSAVIYVNENQIFNDDNYEYKGIGIPFLTHLGQVIYEYERNRRRAFKPDLNRFMLQYDE